MPSSPDPRSPIFFEILCGLLLSSWPKASDEADGNTGRRTYILNQGLNRGLNYISEITVAMQTQEVETKIFALKSSELLGKMFPPGGRDLSSKIFLPVIRKKPGCARFLAIKVPFYFVADAYYAAGKVVNGLLEQGNHLVTRVKSNAVANAPATQKKGRRQKGETQDLRQEDKAQVVARECQIHAPGCQSGLRRAQRHSALPRL